MINQSIALIGVAAESGGVPAEQPTFTHGLKGGALVKPERTVSQNNVACGLRANASNGAFVEEVNMGVDFECPAYADAFGLYALAALGNVTSKPATAAGEGYFEHTITLGSKLPSLTFFGQVGDSSEQTVQRVSGAKVDTLALDFEGNNPLDIGVTAAGIDALLFQSWKGDEQPSCFDGYFIPTDGTFSIDYASQTPAEAVVTKGGFELSNSLTPKRGAGQVVASLLAEGKLKTSVNMTVTPEDWTPIRTVLTGSKDGTKVTPSIVYGSAKWEFTHSQDEKMKLVVEFKNVPWNCETPEVDPEGTGADIEFSAEDVGIASKDGSPIVITVVNKVESYTA